MGQRLLVQRLILGTLILGMLHPGLDAAQTANSPEPAISQNGVAYNPAHPITGAERVAWFTRATAGPKSLAAGVLTSAWGTARNYPKEYGTHWDGFGKRYGLRLTGVATGNAIEAGLGSVWGEDPRYFPSTDSRRLMRVRHAASMVFVANRSDGSQAPAFARYTGIVGGNFISNAWRPPSASTVNAALTRSAVGLAGKFVSNLFTEFVSGIRRKPVKSR